MVALQRVLDAVGPPLASVLALPADPEIRVADLVIVEPDGLPEIHPGDLVLGVAVSDTEQAVEITKECAVRGAAAVLLKEPLGADPGILEAAHATGTGLLAVDRHAVWTQVLWLLRSLLDGRTAVSHELAGQGEFSDLFTLADAIGAVIDAPVTIEDAGSRVLAYSSRQDGADAARVATIIGRRVPDATLAQFRKRGVLRELGKGAEPVFVPGLEDGTAPRLIMPVRVGPELLGSIWAVVPGPVSRERAAAFADTAGVVALHLLRLRAGSDVERRLMRDLVVAMLHGSGDVGPSARRLGLRPGPHQVVAFGLTGAQEDESEALQLALLQRLRSSCGVPARTPLAEVGGTVYAVAQAARPSAEGPPWEWLDHGLADLADGVRVVSGIGGVANTFTELAKSRAQADETLALLVHTPEFGGWARYDDVWARLVVRRVAGNDALAELMEEGPIRTLREHDLAHGTAYVDTLAAWLACPGDPSGAASKLHVHRNTLRYRMRRIAEITPLRLSEPDVRLALHLQLTVLGYPPGA